METIITPFYRLGKCSTEKLSSLPRSVASKWWNRTETKAVWLQKLSSELLTLSYDA